MNRIHKYAVPFSDFEQFTVKMPRESVLLDVQCKWDQPFVWAVVEPDAETEERRFQWFGTGWDIDFQPFSYVGTVQQGYYVWHLFEVF